MSDIKRVNVNGSGSIINPDYDVKLNHTDASLFTAISLNEINGYDPTKGINIQNAIDVLAQKHIILEEESKTHPYITESEDENDNSALDISDTDGNVVVRFYEGHIQTKNFDSSAIIKDVVTYEENGLMISDDKIKLDTVEEGAIDNLIYNRSDNSSAVLNLSDENGYVIVQFKDGHIKTKNFDSRDSGSSGEEIVEYKPWKNKKITILGDSITVGVGASSTSKNYVSQIAAMTEANVINKGVSGTRISQTSNNSFVDRVSSIDTTSDLLIICGGTNDYWHGATVIGSDNSNNPAEYCGALHYIFSWV